MKIAVASVYLGHVARGVETWARDLGIELHRRGLDVTLFKGGGPPEFPYERRVTCADHRRKVWDQLTRITRHGGWRFGLGGVMNWQQVTFGWNLARQLGVGQFDICHLQDPWTARVLERARKMGLHQAQVIMAHGTDETYDFISPLQHVQELAPYYLELDRQRGLPSEKQWFAIPNFVNCQKFSLGDALAARRQFGLPLERVMAFESAALAISRKRLDYLIGEVAAARRQCPELLLVIAGATGPETTAVERLAQRELGEHVRLFKNVAHNDMPALYQAADVFAHPSLREPLGIVFLEAMATGIPCLAHNFPVTQWVIGPGGRTVDMEQPGNLSTALIEYCRQPEIRRQDGQAGREHVVRTFETTHVIDQIVEMYHTVLA